MGPRPEKPAVISEQKLNELLSEAEDLRGKVTLHAEHEEEFKIRNEELIQSIEALKAQAAEMHRQNADLKTENKELLGHASDLMDRFKKLTLEREALEIELRKTQEAAESRLSDLRKAVSGALTRFADRAISLGDLVGELGALGLDLGFEEEKLAQALLADSKKDPVDVVLESDWMGRIRDILREGNGTPQLAAPAPTPVAVDTPHRGIPTRVTTRGALEPPSSSASSRALSLPAPRNGSLPTPTGANSVGSRVLRALASRGATTALALPGSDGAAMMQGSLPSPPPAVVQLSSPPNARPALAQIQSNARDAPSPVAKADGRGGLRLSRSSGQADDTPQEGRGWGGFFKRQASNVAKAARRMGVPSDGTRAQEISAPAIQAPNGPANGERAIQAV